MVGLYIYLANFNSLAKKTNLTDSHHLYADKTKDIFCADAKEQSMDVKSSLSIMKHAEKTMKKSRKNIDINKDNLQSTLQNAIDIERLKKNLPAIDNTQNWLETSSKILGTLAMILAVHWFSGPYTAIAAREIYETLYIKLYGNYRWYDLRYYTLYIPSREHISHLGYEYGPYILNTFLAPIIYKSVGKLWQWGKTIMHIFSKPEALPQPDAQNHNLEGTLEYIISQMENLNLHDPALDTVANSTHNALNLSASKPPASAKTASTLITQPPSVKLNRGIK